ncbi:hypothetical protein A5662_20890 [Mycobacteriaceae bacterium 1482268.1]|nr:hypothetical protein A5662_20890 [Mycobacteriaceae bacterium 1482268.1]
MKSRLSADVVGPRRIALVQFPPSGGLFQFSLQLGEALSRAGDEVELVTGPSPELPSREPGCRVQAILPTWHPTAGASAPAWWRGLRRLVRAGQHTTAWLVLLIYLRHSRPHVIVWSAFRFPIDGWGVRVVRKVMPGAVLALVAHEPRPLVEQPGHEDLYKKSNITDRALAGAYADLDVVFVLGESAKRVLVETWPITAPVHVIPHGDESIYASAAIPAANDAEPVALSFGTITKYKGIATLCDAWPKVRLQVPDAELLIVGALGADIDERALRTRISHLEGTGLHIGYVPFAEVPSYFARARCVVLPYIRASQSGVAHLAFTMRRPVVATRVGDIPSIVIDNVSGTLVEPGDSDGLAAALVHLLSDPELARQMGDVGAAILRQVASWDEVARMFRNGLAFNATRGS